MYRDIFRCGPEEASIFSNSYYRSVIILRERRGNKRISKKWERVRERERGRVGDEQEVSKKSGMSANKKV